MGVDGKGGTLGGQGCPHLVYHDLRCPVPGSLVMSEEGREERDGNLNFPSQSGTLDDQIAT